MMTRRSVRKYTEEKISDEDIKKILSAALLAPSGHSKYPCEFIVVKD
ncbi:MAG: nitroreductase family protein, partial [Selenomonadaceae bacterium]|nr:nitroreductase family protein [Selenomonadaceae bacterium]